MGRDKEGNQLISLFKGKKIVLVLTNMMTLVKLYLICRCLTKVCIYLKVWQITIKEADKGSAVVLMDSDYYKEKVENILSNRSGYEKLPGNADNKIVNKISKLIDQYENCLTQKEIKCSTLFEHKSSLIYCLPKIHKIHTIINEVRKQRAEHINVHNPEDLSSRPTVAGPNFPTH